MRSVASNLGLTYRAQAASVPAARRELSEFARAAGASAGQIDAVRLAVSEALTNAVLHAYGDQPGDVHVTAAVVPGELWVLIADDGRGLEPKTDRPGLGFGLALISQVSDELAIVPRAGGGTEVRMRFDLHSEDQISGDWGETPGRLSGREPAHGCGGHLRGRQQFA